MKPDGVWLTGENLPLYSNRYVHCANSDTFIMGGDRPLLRFGKRRCILGTLRFFNEAGMPLDEAENYTVRIRAGEIRWDVDGVSIHAGAPEGTHGMIVKVISEKPVSILWGGMHYAGQAPFSVQPEFEGTYRTVPFDTQYLGETYTPVPGGFNATRREVAEYLKKLTYMPLHLSLRASFPLQEENGMIKGVCSGTGYIGSFLSVDGDDLTDSLEECYESMQKRADLLCGSLQVHTPNLKLDALCSYEANYQDGMWYPPYHVHSDHAWNIPYLGWTNRYGDDIRGWHDRNLMELKYYSNFQTTENVLTGAPQNQDENLGCMPAHNSRFYGRGHIAKDQNFYNMQTQFFDQAIHSWRMTGSREMAEVLRPMLELHCEWMQECFDPDEDGAYESVIDTWPTDSVWCDGGAAPEATCYAYRAHEACYDLAMQVGDSESVQHHKMMMERIRKGFFTRLWSRDLGIAGRCREQGGYGRLMENPWSYSASLPIDVGMLDEIQAAQSLYYTKWAYQNDPTENGRVIWHSNLVPMIWSVRWKSGEEQDMLAQAFFRTGFPEDGVALLAGKTDDGHFGSDAVRAVMEGLFGYLPNRPRGNVLLAPSMPFDWKDASIETIDVFMKYHREENQTELSFCLLHEARVQLELFAYTDEIISVEGGTLIEKKPGFGRTKVVIDCGRIREGKVILHTRGEKAPILPHELDAAPNSHILLPTVKKATSLLDPQGIANGLKMQNDGILIDCGNVDGHRWLCAEIGGDMPMYEVYHLNLSPTAQHQQLEDRLHCRLPRQAEYHTVALDSLYNCDVQAIYQQKYLSPRPETISARIGVNGYSPWTFACWRCPPPEIHLEQKGTILTKDNVPLQVAESKDNIAFVSLWDNFPSHIDIPVGREGKAAVLLLCGTTNPMQSGGVENVRLTFCYEDGTVEEVPLRNPHELWSLCPLMAKPTSEEQDSINDYDYASSSFCLPKIPPETVQLGENCRAVALRWQLKEGVLLEKITVSAISKEIVFGVMAATIVK